MREQIKDLKKSGGEAVKGGGKRKAEEEEEEAREGSPVKKSLMVFDDDDEVECVVIEEDKAKEIEIKRALRLMITQPPKNNLEVTTVPESPMSNSEEAKVADSSTIGLDVTAVSESQDIKMEETEYPEVNCEDTKVTEGLDIISDEQNISERTPAELKVIVKCEFEEETIFDLGDGEVKSKATARVTRSQSEESALSKSLNKEAVENGSKYLVKNKPEVEQESLPNLSSEENKFAEKAIVGNEVSDPGEVTNILEEEEKTEEDNIVEEEIMEGNNHEKDIMKDTIVEGQTFKRDNIAEEEEMEKHVNLEMSWQLRKWPSLPSVLSR